MNILVTGGAGYIGSHMVKMLLEQHHDVAVIDNLSNGHRDAVPDSVFHEGDIRDQASLDALFRTRDFDAVLHFAACIEVGESVRRPDKYYANNVCGSRALLDAMHRHGVKTIVFSSTAAVYGEPEQVPIPDEHPMRPCNPYGASKWMVERMLYDDGNAFGLRFASLRYFNAAGASSDGTLGERHDPETHLIPLACQAASGRRRELTIYGRDYPTPDGTCIRDYIHVEDLCQAHIDAVTYLRSGGPSTAFNLGYGRGFSVQEVVDAVESVSGRPVPTVVGQRRAGDPVRLVADPGRAHESLGWNPARPKLTDIVADAWRWEQTLAG